MLKGISPLISPKLLETLAMMGHGDEIILADAHFPGHAVNSRVIRADGVKVADLLGAIMPLFELDSYVDHPVVMMLPVEGDVLDPRVELDYLETIEPYYSITKIYRIERQAFYDRASAVFAVVITGEMAKYGNILLKKGVITF